MFRLRIMASMMAVMLFAGLTSPILSQEKPSIAEEALTAPAVGFENRTNRRATPAVRQYERNLGIRIAENALNDRTDPVADIQIFRVFDPNKERYGADVIALGPTTNFGHILAIQRVIAGYLERAFEYKPEQADTISLFIIYYNAGIRSRPELIEKSFSDAVIAKLDATMAGIDRSYKNWPGKTMILIPLRKNVVRPDKADIDREEIKKETEENKDIKKDEKEALDRVEAERTKEDQAKLEQKESELDIKKEQIDQQKKELEEKEQEITNEIVDTGKRLEELRKDPVKNAVEIEKEEQKQQELEKKQEEVKEQQEEIKKQEEAIEQEKKEVQEQKTDVPSRQEEKKEQATSTTDTTKTEEQKKEEVKKEETIAELQKEKEELQKEKEELQKEIEKKEEVSENVVLEKILFMRVQSSEKGHYSNELWYIDTNKDDTLFRSPFTKICSRTFVVVPDQGVMVAGYAGESHEQSEHFLVLLDRENLEFKKQSNESVFWNTPMILRDGKIYAIESFNGQYYLSRFNPDLALDTRSSEGMSPHSEITFFKDKIYVTGQDKEGRPTTIQVFNRSDLKLLKTIIPQK